MGAARSDSRAGASHQERSQSHDPYAAPPGPRAAARVTEDQSRRSWGKGGSVTLTGRLVATHSRCSRPSPLDSIRTHPPPPNAKSTFNPQQNATFLSPTVAGAIPKPFGFETTRDDPASALGGVPPTAPDAPVLSVPAAPSQANPGLVTTMKSQRERESEPSRLGLIVVLLIVTLVVAGAGGAGVMWWVTH